MKLKKLLTELNAELGIGQEGTPIVRYFLSPMDKKGTTFSELSPAQSAVFKNFFEKLKKDDRKIFDILAKGKFDTKTYDVIMKSDGKTFEVQDDLGRKLKTVVLD